MKAIAHYKKISMSPRKARLVVDMVRNMKVKKALEVLACLPNKAAPYIIKVLNAAVANLEAKTRENRILRSNLYIEALYVNGGPVLKRIKPAPRGRAHRIRKPSCHITVEVAMLAIDEKKQLKPTLTINKENAVEPTKEQVAITEKSPKKSVQEKIVIEKVIKNKFGNNKEKSDRPVAQEETSKK